MYLSRIWEKQKAPTISFEFFPARDEKSQNRLAKAIDKLALLQPDFVSVTFGAGGSTRAGSYDLAKLLKAEKNLAVLAYFAGFGLSPRDVENCLEDYRELGIENVLLVRGDPPPADSGFHPHPESFAHGIDLFKFVGPRFDFCLGAPAYPEGHVDALSIEKDIEYLRAKVQHGAQFIITNYFYDNDYFYRFQERCQKAAIDVPIVPGIMPITNVKMMRNLAKLCGATITDQVTSGISALPEDDKNALNDFGVQFAKEQCRDLLRHGVPGLHFYTMDRAKSVVAIVGSLREEGLL